MKKEKNAPIFTPNSDKTEETPQEIHKNSEQENILAAAQEILKKYQKAFLELAK